MRSFPPAKWPAGPSCGTIVGSMRSGLLIPALLSAFLAVVATAGCTVGEGSGTAMGPLWITGCYNTDDVPNYGTETAPIPFDLSPTYFAGEPIEDIGDARPAHNRLIIRMQRNGNAPEITDTLYFDIRFSYEIAQCLRGQTINGVPQWDTTSTGTTDANVTAPWCGAAGPNGVPIINLVPYGPVNVTLTPFGTCHSQAHPPTVIGVSGIAVSGTIEFINFGHAVQAADPPEMRDPVEDDFKVAYGEALTANFHIVLEDERVANAERLKLSPPPDPIIGGTLDGNFDFDLQRGRSAQTFP